MKNVGKYVYDLKQRGEIPNKIGDMHDAIESEFYQSSDIEGYAETDLYELIWLNIRQLSHTPVIESPTLSSL